MHQFWPCFHEVDTERCSYKQIYDTVINTWKTKQYSTFNYECYLISNAYFIHQSLVRKPEFTIRVRILGKVNVLGLINKGTCITPCPLLVQYKARQNWKLQDLEFSCSYYFFINWSREYRDGPDNK